MQSKEDLVLHIEQELMRDRFVEFERGVLQDNILLCDTKAGLLLAFTGAMVVFCVDAIANAHEAASAHNSLLSFGVKALFWAAAGAFLVSSHYSLTTVLPRIVRAKADYIFWESPVFKLSPDEYVTTMRNLDPEVAHDDKLRHLHIIAGICRNKFRHFQIAMRLGRIAFLALILAEELRMFV
jgi:hypothetical protein